MDLGQRVRERRTALGLSQEHLAHRAGVSLNAVHKLEAGRISDPHFSTISGLARALDIRVEDLIREPALAVGKAEAPQETGPPEHGSAYATIRESAHLKSYVRGCIEWWWRVARGEEADIDVDHGYALEVYTHVIALTDWLGNLRHALEVELAPEAAVSAQEEIVALIDDLQDVAAEIHVIADAIRYGELEKPPEELDTESLAFMQALRRELRSADALDEQEKAVLKGLEVYLNDDELAKRRQKHREAQEHAAFAKGQRPTSSVAD